MKTPTTATERAERYPAYLRVMMQIWYTLAMKLKMEDPTPVDRPQHRTGDNAWRVLLFGNGPTHGWGVLSHNYSLTGQLGLAMRDHQRPANIDYVGDELMNINTARDWLADVDLQKYDQVIFCLGWSDAVRLAPIRQWQNDYTDLVTHTKSQMRADASLVLAGIEPLELSLGYTKFVGAMLQTQAEAMNEHLASLVGEGIGYAPLGSRVSEVGRPLGSPVTYRAWGDQIADVAASMLPADRPENVLPPKPDYQWVGTPYVLGFAAGNFTNIIKDIENQAKKELGTDLAQITILDDHRQWMATHSGPAPQSVPRHLTYCDVAVKQEEPLVVPNANTDPRFKDNQYLKMSSMPFYAGTALRSRSGEVIGSFCVLGIAPRPKQMFKMNRYKELLARAQDEIWRIEDEAVRRSIAYDI